MTEDEIRTAVLAALASVAPESRATTPDPAAPLRDQFDLDSMDFINFVVALDEALGVAVPEADYGKLSSVNACVAYCEQALAAGRPGP